MIKVITKDNSYMPETLSANKIRIILLELLFAGSFQLQNGKMHRLYYSISSTYMIHLLSIM